MKITKFRIFAALSVLYAALIFYLSSLLSINISGDCINISGDYFKFPFAYKVADFLEQHSMSFIIDFAHYCYYNIDKIEHMALYFGFGILLYLTFHNSKYTVLRKYAPIVAIIVGVLYGMTDEFHQSYVPGRVSSTADLLANGIGVTIAQIAILILIVIKLANMKRRSKDQDDEQD
ncbi:MAG: VanZ family protein [Methanosarcinaceae archaeon]|nr:VanZ family protein [Methanosarcinaceae archaeon]